jgi:outer membrane protein OmpA-like peptidoglycan-associated protein
LRKEKMKKTMITLVCVGLMTSGCASWDDMSDTSKGAIIGVLGGAAAGAAIGHKNRGKGALIGAVGGGLAGTGIGYYMDSQAKDLQKVLALEARNGQINITKNADNTIMVTMTTNTSFDTNFATIKAGFFPTLDKIAGVVNKYGKTTLTITGYTDNTGSNSINQPLSEQRALAVANYFSAKRVMPERISAYGRGAANPIASNGSAAGRALNRRVEILIEPIIQ